MKKLLFILLSLNIFTLISPVLADEVDDLFGHGTGAKFEFEPFDDNHVMQAIAHDASIVCKDGLCKLTSVDTHYKEFSIILNGGIGNNASGGFGGYGEGNGGTAVIFNRQNNTALPIADRVHANINMSIKVGSCVRNVNVPRALYYAINRYLYGLMNQDSTTRRSLTPADEAMIMFYTTVMKQAEGCR